MSMLKVEVHGKAFSQLIDVQAYMEELLNRKVSVGEVIDLLIKNAHGAIETHRAVKSYLIYESRKNTQHSDN